MLKRAFSYGWRPVASILLLVGLWELVVFIYAMDEWFLPAPSVIYQEAIDVFPTFLPHIQATVKLALIGFFIGGMFGLFLATVLHMFPTLRNAMYPLLVLSQNVPIIVLAPLFIIWFGFGALPKLILIALACFFPIAVSTLGGLAQTDRELVHYMKMMGAGKWQLFWKLEFPYAIPAIFSGLKIAGTYSVMAAVISEWLGAQEGIGVFMTVASSSYRTSRVFVAIVVIMVVSIIFFSCIVWLERWILHRRNGGNQQ